MIRRLFLALFLTLPLAAAAQAPARQTTAPQTVAGSWALRLDGPVLFRFDIAREGDKWRGVWWRPKSFSTDGYRFGDVAAEAVKIDATEAKAIGDWVELSFPDNRPNAVPDVFRFHLTAPDKAEMIYAETGLAPYALERVAADTILGPFEKGKVYRRPGAPPAASTRLPAQPAKPAEKQGPPAFEGR